MAAALLLRYCYILPGSGGLELRTQCIVIDEAAPFYREKDKAWDLKENNTCPAIVTQVDETDQLGLAFRAYALDLPPS
jgi:hypothetical protein